MPVPGDPLPAVVVGGDVAVDEVVEEVPRPDGPPDVEVLGEEARRDHPQAVVHEALARAAGACRRRRWGSRCGPHATRRRAGRSRGPRRRAAWPARAAGRATRTRGGATARRRRTRARRARSRRWRAPGERPLGRAAMSASIVRGWISPYLSAADIRLVESRSGRSRSLPYAVRPLSRKAAHRSSAASLTRPRHAGRCVPRAASSLRTSSAEPREPRGSLRRSGPPCWRHALEKGVKTL